MGLIEHGFGVPIRDHGLLTGLADNDHPQYALKSGDTFTGLIIASGGIEATTIEASDLITGNAGAAVTGSLIATGTSGQVTSLLSVREFGGTERFGVLPDGRQSSTLTLVGDASARYAADTNVTLDAIAGQTLGGVRVAATIASGEVVDDYRGIQSRISGAGVIDSAYGFYASVSRSSASAQYQAIGVFSSVSQTGLGQIEFLAGHVGIVTATRPATDIVGNYFSVTNSGASATNARTHGAWVLAANSGVISDTLYGIRLGVTQSGTAANVSALDIAVTGTGLSSTYAIKTSGGTHLFGGTTTITPAANTSGLVVSGASLTGSNAQSLVNLSATWNTSGTPTAILLNVTNTASNAASKLIDLQVGGVSQFSVTRGGVASVGSTLEIPYSGAAPTTTGLVFRNSDLTVGSAMGQIGGGALSISLGTATSFSVRNSSYSTILSILNPSGLIAVGHGSPGGRFHIIPSGTSQSGFISQSFSAGQIAPTFSIAKSNNLLGITMLDSRFRLYNTSDGFLSDSPTNYERLAFEAVSNEYRFTSQAGGTGVIRPIVFSVGDVGIGTTPTAKLDVNSDIIRLRTAKTPASAAAEGNTGDIAWDSGFIYVCVANATWHRVPHASW